MILISVNFCYSQRINTTNNNLWIVYNGDHKFSEKFGVHFEFQERRSELGKNNQQHLFRTGLNYHFLTNVFVTAGYAFVETYPYGNFAVKSAFPEHRIYEQLQYTTNLGQIEAVSRFRIEQRFSFLPILQSDSSFKSNAEYTYTNRFRYFQRFSVPFKGQKINDKTLYLSVYDEFFINFGKNVGLNIFDQNRAFFGLGYKIPKVGKLEFGYLNQILLKSDGIKVENNNTLLVSLNANFDWKK